MTLHLARIALGTLGLAALLFAASGGSAQTGMPGPAAAPVQPPPAPAPAPDLAPAVKRAEAPPDPAGTAEGIEPKAEAVLQDACARLAAARTMSFTAVNMYEKAARNGQPLFYATLNRVTMQRPDKLRVITPGDGTPDEFYYDGKTMMAYVPSADLVAIDDAPPTLDELLDSIWKKAAIYFPFDDVITSKPCDILERNLKSAFYVGRSAVVGGTTTDIVALAGTDIQAVLWIGAEDRLPRMVRVVYPKEPKRALYQTEYSDWRIDFPVPPGTFTSAKALQAHRMAFQPPGPAAPIPPRAPIQ